MNKYYRFLIPGLLFLLLSITSLASKPGPNYFYECSNCKSVLQKQSLMSYNSMETEVFSDGYTRNLGMPNQHFVIKCQTCNSILWLSDLKLLGTCAYKSKDCNPKWANAPYITGVNIDDLKKTLTLSSVQSNRHKEKKIRVLIWHRQNNHIGLEKQNPISEFQLDTLLYVENCKRLIDLMDTSRVEDLILQAELYRNIGLFTHASNILNALITDPSMPKKQVEILKQYTDRIDERKHQTFKIKL